MTKKSKPDTKKTAPESASAKGLVATAGLATAKATVKSKPAASEAPKPAPAEPEQPTEGLEAAEPEHAPAEPEKPSTIHGPNGEFGVPSEHPLIMEGEQAIVLKNLRNKRVDIVLEHAVYCEAIGRCVCSRRDVIRERPIERKSKAMAVRVENILMPRTIILAPMGTSEPLNKAAEKCADVRSKVINRPQRLKILPA